MTTDTGPEAQPALDQLLDLAEATRPDIDRTRLHSAVIAARTAGWTWPRTLTAVTAMLTRGEDTRDLLNAINANPDGRYVRGGYIRG